MTYRLKFSRAPLAALLTAAVAATTLLGACAPLVLGGAMVGGAMSYTDRRTAGTQVEDETIELKAISRVGSVSGGHVNITSFNRSVLLTGEAPTEAERAAVEKTVSQIENVRTIFNNDSDNTSGLGVGTDREYFETYEGKLINTKGVKARYIRFYSKGSTESALNEYTELEVYARPAK